MTGEIKEKPQIKKKQKRLTKKRKAEIKAKAKAKKLRVRANQKKNQKLEVYDIPSTILYKYKQEVFAADNIRSYLDNVRFRCHQQTYEEFSSLEVPSNLANFMTAFKHATEDQNFKLLYELLGKALKIRNPFLLQQIYEYFYIAIQHDDKICDRDQVLSEFLDRVRLLKNCDPKKYQLTEQTFSYIDDKNSDNEEKPAVGQTESETKIESDSSSSNTSSGSDSSDNSSSSGNSSSSDSSTPSSHEE